MDHIDSALEKRVWDRVRTEAPQQEEFYPGVWTVRELETAKTCEELSRRMTGGPRVTLQSIAREDRRHLDCMKGMCILTRGTCPSPAASTRQYPTPVEAALRKLYAMKLRAAREYRAHTANPEYGIVFAQLAQQEEHHCRQLLELLGQLQT